MKKTIVAAGIFAVAAVLGTTDVSAQGRGHGGGMGASMGSTSFGSSTTTGLNRADQAAGVHGAQGRAIARTHGANKPGFCPPGQAKKLGLGSRFKC